VNLNISSTPTSKKMDVREDDVEHEVSSQRTLRDTLGHSLASSDLVVENGRKTSVDRQHTSADKGTYNQNFTPRHSISQGDCRHCSNTGYDRVEKVVGELL
jgi:hypothetical protein